MQTGPRGPTSRSPTPFHAATKTVENIRQRCVLEGFEQALERFPRSPNCSTASRRLPRPASGAAPEGLRELVVAPAGAAGRRVGDIESISHDHPADAKKNGMTRRKIQYWVIPPQCRVRGAHGTGLGSVSETLRSGLSRRVHGRAAGSWSRKPARRWRPKNRPRRVDYEYERAGTAAVFLFSEPLAGWRQATARARRTKVDWALEVAGLLDGRYADCEKITLVCDHLNTHTKGAFYEVFEPARARELVRRIEFCHTPKHGSWLN